MDKFLALTEEKRLTILNAALQCFGKFGYEKASINDIAVAAHISKASVFQYFGSKKQLYIYLLEYCKKIIEGIFDKEALDSQTDLFDRIMTSSKIEMESFQNTALHSPIYFQRLGGNFSRCTGFAGHPDGRNLQVQKRYDFAGR